MKITIKLILKGGLIATAVMTMFMLVAPLMGMPKMLIGNSLAAFMHIPVFLGWVAHFMIGTTLAAFYVLFFKALFHPGNALKGLLFALIPFVMAQAVMMPIMGGGFFSSQLPSPISIVMGSLAGHIVYGIVLGLTTKTENEVEKSHECAIN